MKFRSSQAACFILLCSGGAKNNDLRSHLRGVCNTHPSVIHCLAQTVKSALTLDGKVAQATDAQDPDSLARLDRVAQSGVDRHTSTLQGRCQFTRQALGNAVCET